MRIFQALPATVSFLMHRQGINQSELARRSGLRPAQISRYLSGDVEPKGRQLERLAEALGLRLSTLFMVAEQMQQLQKLVQYRPSGVHLRTTDPVFQHLLEAALEALAAVDGGAMDGPLEDGDGGGEETAVDRSPVATLFEAQRLLQQGQRLTLEALHQLTTPSGG